MARREQRRHHTCHRGLEGQGQWCAISTDRRQGPQGDGRQGGEGSLRRQYRERLARVRGILRWSDGQVRRRRVLPGGQRSSEKAPPSGVRDEVRKRRSEVILGNKTCGVQTNGGVDVAWGYVHTAPFFIWIITLKFVFKYVKLTVYIIETYENKSVNQKFRICCFNYICYWSNFQFSLFTRTRNE